MDDRRPASGPGHGRDRTLPRFRHVFFLQVISMIDLTGQVALITGGSRGIGRACALRLAEAGADIAVNYVVNRQAAMAVAEEVAELGRRVLVVKADVSEEDDVRSMLDAVKQEYGKLDILLSERRHRRIPTAVGRDGPQFPRRLPDQRAGALVPGAGVGTADGTQGRRASLEDHHALKPRLGHRMPYYGLIGSSKAALESLVRHLTLEIGDRGININVVKSGLVDTDSTRRLPNAEAIFEGRKSKAMMGDRMLTAADVADAVLFLASPLSDLVQGEVLTVDGGAAIHP